MRLIAGWHAPVSYNTIQQFVTRTVSVSLAESEARAVAGGKWEIRG